jgi:hypothetical protein
MHPDTTYLDHDLVKAYIARKGVKYAHTEALEVVDELDAEAIVGTGSTWCGLELTNLKPAGWLRGLERRGLSECAKCATRRDAFTFDESLEDAPESAEEATTPDSAAKTA